MEANTRVNTLKNLEARPRVDGDAAVHQTKSLNNEREVSSWVLPGSLMLSLSSG